MISIIIPVYNAEKHIKNTLLSIVQQTEKEFEIILINDGSTDDGVQVANNTLKNVDVPYQIISQTNSGQGIARNTGIQYAQGEWIYFMDSDDVIQPYAFSMFKNVVNDCNGEVDIVYSSYQYVSDSDLFKPSEQKLSYQVYSKKEMLHGFLTREKVVLVPGTFYKKKFLEENRIKHNAIRWSEDQYFMWQVLSKITSAVYIDCVLYNYYRHPISIMSSTSTEVILDAYREFEKMSLDISEGEIRKFLLPRWVLGCAHEIAQRNSFDEWEDFGKKINIKEKLRILLEFPSWKVKILSVMGLVSDGLMYQILRKR